MFYKIRDCVDVYTLKDNILMFYFINTRKTYEYKVNEGRINLISLINGERSVDDLVNVYNITYKRNVSKKSIMQILAFLMSINVVVEIDPNYKTNIDSRYERQINYLSELSLGEFSGIENHKKLVNTKFLILGVGGVGGDIALLLAMAGVKEITVLDHDNVTDSDIARHMYFRKKYIGCKKVDAIKEELSRINPDIIVNCLCLAYRPDTNIDEWIDKSDFVINSADEPYIGYTSIKLSRKCYEKNKPHYIAGGFDIHVMSTGELIIPGVTPCVNCYMRYFKKKLSNWTPENKKVYDTMNEYGGFASQSLFSASYATTQIIKYICGSEFESERLTRGEVDFEKYNIQYLDVKKDPECPVCGGGVKNESKDS